MLRPLTISLAVITVLSLPTALHAQEVSVENALVLCMEPALANDRLECFEALARAAAPKESANVEQKRIENRNLAVANNQPTPSNEETTTAQEAKPEKRAGLFSFGRFKKSTQKFVFVKPGEQPKPNRAPRHIIPERIAYDATILKAWRNAVNELYVALDNGEVWKHVDPGRPRMPKANMTVKIKPGMGRSWYMSFSDKRPRLRIKLIRVKPPKQAESSGQ
ncbi:MAG: hypothetical protein JKY46_05920 [Robiginitomaculum sp.]|nr:hypothetical protein [Robiginitomaculum sp.]